MNKLAIMSKYELVVIVDAKLAAEAKDSIFKSVVDNVIKSGGKVINSQVWMEKHRLTFNIKKCNEGTYFLVNFEGEGSVANKIKPELKLNERILRFSIINVD